MVTTRHKTKQTPQTPPSQTVDMNQVQQMVDKLPKGSDELRWARNLIWKKIAEPVISDEAMNDVRNSLEKLGYDIWKKTVSKVNKEYKMKKEEEVS